MNELNYLGNQIKGVKVPLNGLKKDKVHQTKRKLNPSPLTVLPAMPRQSILMEQAKDDDRIHRYIRQASPSKTKKVKSII